MKRLLQFLLAIIGLSFGCSKSGLITRSEFTEEFAKELRGAGAQLKVTIVKEMELKVAAPDGNESAVYLDNAYDLYRQGPESKSQVMRKFVASVLETTVKSEGIDRNRIVAVIKDRSWLDEVRKAVLVRGQEKFPEYIFDELNTDLLIFYAEDLPQNIRYLTPKELESAKLERSDLRTLASENIKRMLLPKLERQGTNGVYMLTAGGDYEASLLVVDSIWSTPDMDLDGDPVVAIPTRDLLLVTGSKNAQGIEILKKMTAKASSEGAYRLTQKLFIYRQGKFVEFTQ